MPIPSSISSLDTNPNNNSPQGSESVGPNANGYIQALSAFIKQLANGGLTPNAPVNLNAQKLTNLAAGAVSSTSTDAVNGSQLQAVYKVGEVKMWHGVVANIGTAWGAGWQLCDGTNGTADLRDRFVVGAGTTYAPNATGGLVTNTLTTGQLPAHNHAVTDGGHGHGVNDGGHSHGTSETPHFHGGGNGKGFVNLSVGGGTHGVGAGGGYEDVSITATSSTGLSIQSAGTGISIAASGSNISTQNTGSGAAVENRPPYYALCFIEYTGIGA